MAKKGRYQLVGGLAVIGRPDPRYGKFRKQLKATGVSPDETWNLNTQIAVYLVPRLQEFIKLTTAYPPELGSLKAWRDVLKEMIEGFKLFAAGDDSVGVSDEADAKMERSLDLLRKWYRYLWW